MVQGSCDFQDSGNNGPESDPPAPLVILGDALMKTYYTRFDKSAKTVAFACAVQEKDRACTAPIANSLVNPVTENVNCSNGVWGTCLSLEYFVLMVLGAVSAAYLLFTFLSSCCRRRKRRRRYDGDARSAPLLDPTRDDYARMRHPATQQQRVYAAAPYNQNVVSRNPVQPARMAQQQQQQQQQQQRHREEEQLRVALAISASEAQARNNR